MIKADLKWALKHLIIALLLSLALPALAEETYTIEEHMPFKKFKEAGLEKLSPEEIKVFNAWFNEFVHSKADSMKTKDSKNEEKRSGILGIFGNPKMTYKIQKIDEKILTINKQRYEIIRSCTGFNEGDMVTFIKGSPHGLCETATFVHNRSSERCQVWCDDI
jgi:hypothetical protein